MNTGVDDKETDVAKARSYQSMGGPDSSFSAASLKGWKARVIFILIILL